MLARAAGLTLAAGTVHACVHAAGRCGRALGAAGRHPMVSWRAASTLRPPVGTPLPAGGRSVCHRVAGRADRHPERPTALYVACDRSPRTGDLPL